MLGKMRYRLALDMGSTSIGWCLFRLDSDDAPCAVIRAGVRIFSDGRNPKDGSSLAVTRRLARQMRRRRDRLLQRKQQMQKALVDLGFWPQDDTARKALSALDPYTLRHKGLDEALKPEEFGRALFHLNQRRGFKSNRTTDKKDNDSGLLKTAIKTLREHLVQTNARTVGEWLAKRHAERTSVRARLRGTSARDKAYDLYIDRAMVADEFDALWAAQAAIDPQRYSEPARERLRHILLFQRPLKPVKPGRCTLIPTEPRALLALPSVQRFRIYQELNHLRLQARDGQETALTLEQRNTLAAELEERDLTFPQLRKVLGLPSTIGFNLADGKREKLKGNASAQRLAKADALGTHWSTLPPALQDEVVERLLTEPNEATLVQWLVEHLGVDEPTAQTMAEANFPPGYGNLSKAALARVLPALQAAVVPYSDAVVAAGFESHSALSHVEQTGELMEALPYYGELLQRHVGFAATDAGPEDPPEKRFGRIANPTVHIGLNELRKVVNALIKRYGNPAQIVVEVARELKQSQLQKQEEQKRQATRQNENDRFRQEIAELRGSADTRVTIRDIQRMRLWVELNPSDCLNRRCPYTGELISTAMLMSPEVEEEHILPFSKTLDDSLNNKTLSLRRANRDKGSRTPFEAFGHNPQGYDYDGILARASLMPKEKQKRFIPDAYERWLREDKDFLARALNDTAYLSRIAREYLSVICPPHQVWVIPGRLTAMLRGLFGLNKVLSLTGVKNRDDHRHHAVDAAVIGVTDRAMLMRFAQANANTRAKQLDRLVEDMQLPWPTYRERVAQAIASIVVSHRPDHGHEGALHNATAYGLRPNGQVVHRMMLDAFKSAEDLDKRELADPALKTWLIEQTQGLSGKAFAQRLEELRQKHGVRRVKVVEKRKVIPISEPGLERHGIDEDGVALPYKGYDGNSNYCIEIWRDEKGRWKGDVISTFDAHRIVREHGGGKAGWRRLRHPALTCAGQALVMRLCIGDGVRMTHQKSPLAARLVTIKSTGEMLFAGLNEANVDARNRDKDDDFSYVSKSPGTLQTSRARLCQISPIGAVNDPGFIS